MSLEKALRKAVERFNPEMTEAQVKLAVIQPILRALDWDDSDPDEFDPEFPVPEGNVDYALLRAPDNPLVFIEAKRPGGVDVKAEEQLFRYANNKGVPFLILTDGNLWDFYLSMAAGDPPDRQFYRVELTNEERIPEYVQSLETYLRKNRVVSEQARVDAEQRHKTNRESGKARKAIPGVWRTLLETPDDMLRDLLAEEVARECGTRPRLEDVEAFLKRLSSEAVQSPPRSRPPRSTTASTTPRRQSMESGPASSQTMRNRPSKIVGFVLGDKEATPGNATQTLAEVLNEFARRDSGFMERFADKTVGEIRRLVARKRDDLYINSPHLIDSSLRLENGWWLATNSNTGQKREYIQIACEVAGVKFGSQLTLQRTITLNNPEKHWTRLGRFSLPP